MPKIDHYVIDDDIYEIVPEIAPRFDEDTAYVAGDYVIKDAILYRFIVDHAAGEWTGLDVESTTVTDELRSVNNEIKLTLGRNMDDLVDPGTYYCESATVSNSLINLPDYAVGRQFVMKVIPSRVTKPYIIQFLYIATKTSTSYRIYMRQMTEATSPASPWGNWAEVYQEGNHIFLDVKYLTRLADGTDLDDIVEYGSYFSNSATTTRTMLNVPFFVDSSFSLYVVNSKQSSTDGTYVRQFIFANKKALSSVYTRAKNADEGGWGEWQLLVSGDMYEHPKVGEASTFVPSAKLTTPVKKTVKVGTNNVAHYWLQGYEKQYLNDYPVKIAKWRRWLMKADLDILFLQECEDRINRRSEGTAVTAFSSLYAPFFDSDTNVDTDVTPREDGTSDTTSPSRRKILNRLGWDTNTSMRTVSSLDPTYTKSGYYNWTEITLENNIGTLLLINVHNFAGASSERVMDRANYLNDISTFIATKNPTYFIIAGDFNLKVPESDYANILSFCNSINAKPVNGGIIGWFVTSSAEETDRPYDNIIVSSNIEIRDIECDPILVAIGAIHTDHLPVSAVLEFH